MEIFISLLAGLLINLVAWLSLKIKLRTDVIVLISAVVLGIAYQTFRIVIPVAEQELVIDFISKAMAASWVVWQFLVKPIANPVKAV